MERAAVYAERDEWDTGGVAVATPLETPFGGCSTAGFPTPVDLR